MKAFVSEATSRIRRESTSSSNAVRRVLMPSHASAILWYTSGQTMISEPSYSSLVTLIVIPAPSDSKQMKCTGLEQLPEACRHAEL